MIKLMKSSGKFCLVINPGNQVSTCMDLGGHLIEVDNRDLEAYLGSSGALERARDMFALGQGLMAYNDLWDRDAG